MKTVERSTSDILFIDLETTGVPDFKAPSDGETQPHVIEFGALRYSPAGELVGVVDLLVKPEGWTIPDDVIEIHGITNELAHERGSAEPVALAALMSLYDGCALRVAHNRSFDDRIMRIALKRFAGDEAAESFKAQPGACTALLSKPLCQLPPTEAMKKTNFKNSFKTPNLGEAFEFLSGGKTVEIRHRAMPDAQICARVYFMMQGIRMPAFPDDLPRSDEEAVAELETEPQA